MNRSSGRETRATVSIQAGEHQSRNQDAASVQQLGEPEPDDAHFADPSDPGQGPHTLDAKADQAARGTSRVGEKGQQPLPGDTIRRRRERDDDAAATGQNPS